MSGVVSGMGEREACHAKVCQLYTRMSGCVSGVLVVSVSGVVGGTDKGCVSGVFVVYVGGTGEVCVSGMGEREA